MVDLKRTSTLLQRVSGACSSKERSGEMTETDSTTCISGEVDGKISDLQFKMHQLRRDVLDMDMMAEILDRVCLLDNSLRVVNKEVPDVNFDVSAIQKKRENIAYLVRAETEYDEEKYGSRMAYEQSIIVETEKRFNSTDTHGSALLADVSLTLKRTGIRKPATLTESICQEVMMVDRSSRSPRTESPPTVSPLQSG